MSSATVTAFREKHYSARTAMGPRFKYTKRKLIVFD